MIVGDNLAQRLVDHLTEGWTVELKRWLVPAKPDDVARIVTGRGAKPTTAGKCPAVKARQVLVAAKSGRGGVRGIKDLASG
jgi:hypothetical protein